MLVDDDDVRVKSRAQTLSADAAGGASWVDFDAQPIPTATQAQAVLSKTKFHRTRIWVFLLGGGITDLSAQTPCRRGSSHARGLPLHQKPNDNCEPSRKGGWNR